MSMTSEAMRLDATFKALGDLTRRALVARLLEGEERVTDLAGSFDMSLPAVSKHIRILEKAGLVERRREGREHRIALTSAPFKEAESWLSNMSEFWETRLDQLQEAIVLKRKEQK